MNRAALINLSLLALFGLQHSLMARQSFKQIVNIPRPRRAFALATLAVLAVMALFWQPMPELAWHFKGAIAIGLYIVWTFGLQLILFGAMSINARELLGLAEPAPPEFHTPFLYTIVRHPIYLGAIMVLWAAPRMTHGRLLFAAAMTLYILIGIQFEERDLERTFGEVYRVYKQRVPMLIPSLQKPLPPQPPPQ
ncbi:MAG: isoprenylcysteine carboxylmethyltransferase family protein [Bryobacterales bacterium]|nr:isoprenylcysteine carboxylmethyltransferase family protein [Bryobacterales bacterium]